MATGNGASIHAGFRGKVGTVTLSTWLSVDTMRSNMPANGKKKLSPKQLTQTEIMKLVSSFLSRLLALINITYQQARYPDQTKMNEAVSYHIRNALVGDDTNRFFDLTKLKLSKPIRSTQSVWKPTLVSETALQIKITWELNPFPLKSTQLDDQVFLIFYLKSLDMFDTIRGPRRDELTFTYTAPKNTVDKEVFCYMVISSADEKLVSPTKYLGMVTVMA